MRQTIIALVVPIMSFSAIPTDADADATRSILVPGAATVEVAPDRLVIAFELLTERDTFAEAAEGARHLSSALGAIRVPEDGVSVSVAYDLTFMRQKSWGRGRKLEHRFQVTVDGVPESEAQELLVHFIDKSLALEDDLTVEHFQAVLSEQRTLATRKRLLEEAVADARTNAMVLADAGGLRVVSPLALSVAGSSPLAMLSGIADIDAFPGRLFQRSFAVTAPLPSRIRESVSVVAQFAVEPR